MSDWQDQEADVNDHKGNPTWVPEDDAANVTRVEVIDEYGRAYARARFIKVQLVYQDGGRTLKVMVGPR